MCISLSDENLLLSPQKSPRNTYLLLKIIVKKYSIGNIDAISSIIYGINILNAYKITEITIEAFTCLID